MAASWKIEKTAFIRQPAELVYHYLSRFDHIREWDPGVLSARMTPPATPTVGSRFSLTLLFGYNRVPMTYEIVSMTPDREVVLKGRGATFEAVDHIRLEAVPEGTRLIYSAEVMFHQPPRQPVDWLLERVFRHGSRRAVARLQRGLSACLSSWATPTPASRSGCTRT